MIDVRFSHVHLIAHDTEVTARWFVGGPAADGVMAGERQWRDVDVAGIRLFVSPRVPDGVAASDAAARGAVDPLALAVASIDAAIVALTAAGTPVMKRFSNLGPVFEQPLLKGSGGLRIQLPYHATTAAHCAG